MKNGIVKDGIEYSVSYTREIARCRRCAFYGTACRSICLVFVKQSRLQDQPIFNKPE